MKKTFKTTIAGILMAGTLVSGAAYAEYNHDGSVNLQGDIMTISEPLVQTAPVTKPIYKMFVNDTLLEADVHIEGELIMLPLRALCEALDYEVGYDAETTQISLTRGAHYITMYPTKDEYTFSKMAPASLGAAPMLIEDRTYVPIQFVDEILQSAGVSVDQNGEIRISDPKKEENPFRMVTVLEDVKDGSALVADETVGEVLVSFTEETVFLGIALDEIKKDTQFAVQFSEAMTLSLPPQTVALNVMSTEVYEEISKLDEEPEEIVPETISFEGTIKEVGEDFVLVTVGETEIQLNISEETLIRHTVNRRLYRINDLTEGMKISGVHSAAATFSLPPQSAALEIVISE